MKLVIEIDEENYHAIKRGVTIPTIVDRLLCSVLDGTPLDESKCKWIFYDMNTVCPKEHDIDNPYWMYPRNRTDVLKYCPYCGKEIEFDASSD